MIFGKKVFVRPIEVEDLPLIIKWRNDPEVARYIWAGVPYLKPLAKERAEFENLQRDSSQHVFVICESSSKKPIGKVSIHDITERNRSGMLSIFIGETEYLGKGCGTEAVVLFLRYCFRILNLHRVMLEVYEHNERAIRAYEKVGFVKEGLVRRSAFKDGRYINEYFMGILKEEYYAKYPEKIGE